MYYYCTCDPNRRSATNLGRTPYRRVKADNEGVVCLDCGYYAIACRENLDPDTSLRAWLMDDHDPPPEKRNWGGLSVKNQKQYERRNGQKRESEAGDLDV